MKTIDDNPSDSEGISRRLASVGPWTVFVFYAAIALEVIIMITPFTAYFYSVYAPALGFLEAHRATAWLTAFFLPHISYSPTFIVSTLAVLGPVLIGLGLVAFLVCAFQVYSAKLLRRGVVSGGLYRMVRHPQYLSLAVAGLGLLLYWPRFLILVFYVLMLFLYHLLARDEERRMTAKHGDAYRAYARSMPMFIPGNPGGRLRSLLPGERQLSAGSLTGIFVLTLIGALGVAAGLRSYSKGQLTEVLGENILAVSLTGGDEETLRARIGAALDDPDVRDRIATHPKSHTLVAYVLPQDYMMQHLIADLGEHESHHGGGDNGGIAAAVRHLFDMYTLKPLRQLRAGARSPNQRVIFTMAETSSGDPTTAERALAVDVLRIPLFFTDLEADRPVMTMDTPPRHSWGTIPVPAF
jgi:protein-S-isoprenylcysteine O-methyltransferase Ste14